MLMDINPYDELYKQMDFINKPFGYSSDELMWITSKVKGELARYITTNGKILDVGGGYGLMTKFLPDFVKKKNYVNMDISIVMLKHSPYQNVLAVAEQIPFRSASFDYVILSEVLEHVNDKIKVLRECYRILKSRGLLLLSTPREGWLSDFKRSYFLPFYLVSHIFSVVGSKLGLLKPQFQIPDGVKDEYSNEMWLRESLEGIGFKVIEQYRANNILPWANTGQGRFWHWFADRFVDPKKWGHCTIVICAK